MPARAGDRRIDAPHLVRRIRANLRDAEPLTGIVAGHRRLSTVRRTQHVERPGRSIHRMANLAPFARQRGKIRTRPISNLSHTNYF
ncbi:hypothetical protein [Burkholderia vietnamiensis]|uniref:hypothetical protein n=1 Tax=Burkholderia vietnamiensis TaxID=60552 RepID=UPI0011B58ED2|nr:hypothetical protein [Burkholderia vietnamiensis]